MTLIKSISGIRGTIGGNPGEGLSPLDIVKFTGAYLMFLKKKNPDKKLKIIVGRDARISGKMVNHVVIAEVGGVVGFAEQGNDFGIRLSQRAIRSEEVINHA